jgi:hypothetical protein
MNALLEGGQAPPRWMRLGLEALFDAAISGSNQIAPATGPLYQVGQAGALLGPTQFANPPANIPGLAEAEAVSLMVYFYDQDGPGAVVETLQRIGSGESDDDAMQATTGGDQMAFFKSWNDAVLTPP